MVVGPVRKIKIVTSDMLATADIANYLISLEEDFYKLFGINRFTLHSILVDSLQDPSSEYYSPTLFFSEDNFLGFYISNPTKEILQKRAHDFKILLKASRSIFRKKEFEGFAPSNLSQFNGAYLSKIYVAPPYRNRGFGKIILTDFLNSNRMLFSKAMLHVLKNNKNAKQFYRANGFVCVDADLGHSNYDFMEHVL